MKRTIWKLFTLAAAALALSLTPASSALAGDTLELFEIGATDFEFLISYNGIGKEQRERGFGGKLLLGYGLTDWLSGKLVVGAEGNENFMEGTGGFTFGIFSTPLDTEHADLDLGLDIGLDGLEPGGAGPAEHFTAGFAFTPYLELNLDSLGDMGEMGGHGAYLVLSEVLTGRDESRADGQEGGESIFKTTPHTDLTLGAYYSVAEGRQLFISYNMIFNHRNAEDEHKTEVGGVALGYNFFVAERLEIITEVFFDIPQADEEFGVNFLVGLIATLPKAAKN